MPLIDVGAVLHGIRGRSTAKQDTAKEERKDKGRKRGCRTRYMRTLATDFTVHRTVFHVSINRGSKISSSASNTALAPMDLMLSVKASSTMRYKASLFLFNTRL